MKHLFTFAFLLCFLSSFGQWTKVEQLPSSDILSLYHKDNTLYAGGLNRIYISRNNGQTWDSTSVIPTFSTVSNIIVYKTELYASSFSHGVYKSTDGGNTWQNITTGIFPEVSDFTEWRGDLYASTLGSSVYKLDPIQRDRWTSFSNGLSSISLNATSIIGTSNTLIAGTIANGYYNYLAANTTTWEERLLLGQLRPAEGIYDIVGAHDSLFLAGHTGRCYMSTDNGLNWSRIGNILRSENSSLANTKQALLISRSVFDGVRFNTFFDYIRKDALQAPFNSFSFVANNLTYKIDVLGDKIWDATGGGLYFMLLSDLPGITAAEDPVTPITLPAHFTFFNTECEGNKVLVSWKVTQEQNSHHYDIERSTDGIHWTVIGSMPIIGNNSFEQTYSFTDEAPGQNGYYRVGQIDKDGKTGYTNTLRSPCNTTEVFSLWPNPAHERVYINITTTIQSEAIIKIFDSKGALVKLQRAAVSPGSQLSIDIQSLVNGRYSLSIEWDNGKSKKTVKLIRQ